MDDEQKQALVKLTDMEVQHEIDMDNAWMLSATPEEIAEVTGKRSEFGEAHIIATNLTAMRRPDSSIAVYRDLGNSHEMYVDTLDYQRTIDILLSRLKDERASRDMAETSRDINAESAIGLAGQLGEAEKKIESLGDEIIRLRNALVDVHSHMPYLKDGETRDEYNIRALAEMREMARKTLTKEG